MINRVCFPNVGLDLSAQHFVSHLEHSITIKENAEAELKKAHLGAIEGIVHSILGFVKKDAEVVWFLECQPFISVDDKTSVLFFLIERGLDIEKKDFIPTEFFVNSLFFEHFGFTFARMQSIVERFNNCLKGKCAMSFKRVEREKESFYSFIIYF